MSSTRSRSAASYARRSSVSETTWARSKSVLATEVTGIPSISARSSGCNAPTEWIVKRGREQRRAPTTVTSMAARSVSQIPDRGCVAVAEDGAFSAGKYGGRPPTLSSDRTNGIDTSMQTPKPSIGDTTPDRRGVDSQRSQLPESYYPVLSTCESADERVK